MITDRYSKEQLCVQKLIRKLRMDCSLSQGMLAKQLNVPQSLISKYECGERHLTFVEIVAICGVLDCDIDDFSLKFKKDLKARMLSDSK